MTNITKIGTSEPYPGRDVVYLGWQGFSNFGDDLLYETWRAALGKRLELQAPLGDAYLRAAPRVIAARFRGIRRERILLLGGGTTVGFANWAQHVDRARFVYGTKATVIAGAGVADVDDTHALSTQTQDWARWGKMNDVILFGLRGPISLENTERSWRRSSIIGDPALLYPEVAAVEPHSDRTGIVVSIGSGGSSRFNLTEVAAAVRQLAIDMRQTVTIVQLAEEDAAVCAAFRSMLRIPSVSQRFVNDVNEIMRIFASATLILSERLHGTVAGFALRRPTVSLSYASKCDDFWRSVVEDNEPVKVDAGRDEVIRAARQALDPTAVFSRNARVDQHCDSLRTHVAAIKAWADGSLSTQSLGKLALGVS